MFLTCVRVSRPIGTGSGNSLVFGVHRSVTLAIENAPVEITQCMHNKIDREWNEYVRGMVLGFVRFIEIFISDFIVRK